MVVINYQISESILKSIESNKQLIVLNTFNEQSADDLIQSWNTINSEYLGVLDNHSIWCNLIIHSMEFNKFLKIYNIEYFNRQTILIIKNGKVLNTIEFDSNINYSKCLNMIDLDENYSCSNYQLIERQKLLKLIKRRNSSCISAKNRAQFCNIRIKLPNSSLIVHEFDLIENNLNDIRKFLTSKISEDNIDLNQFIFIHLRPRKDFTKLDEIKTLKSVGIDDKTTLYLVKHSIARRRLSFHWKFMFSWISSFWH
ncbi:hypothetical protein KAFR_0C04270 [Kazachstania africana CBS 2517]|uniref:UBX domain-containing protein n=1 Tax=Kazachstania africana (strain ATCC 22294 / BCRC 22015 / CBS 2517 / CECT 1963 / NBRC 1671 / NRRL Y-8276) TaxID=1071382 RepID=H2ASR8_KAZAF|nr:hypothetical protein KAFR_0C04270 [Kazachstania africana CBS 2517]CCF57418.1 hypothetical protein KAFR_0C04270 [Kazachstania africana CBS 2517]